MKSRCYCGTNSSFDDYGGRGISVCDRWMKSFAAFVEDMGPRPPGLLLDRIDNDGNYEPGNCRWVDARTSGFNTRRTRLITIGGRTQHPAAWERETGINSATIIYRHNRGMTAEEILNPAKRSNAGLKRKGTGRPTKAQQAERAEKLKATLGII